MFHCRDFELNTMEKRYQKGGFECIVVYGRRRVGKTALINAFCKDKPTIYFSALNASADENLVALSRAIGLYQDPERSSSPTFSCIADAFDEITRLAQKERFVFVIDEYPYLARADVSVSSRLQHLIDHLWQDLPLYLILCGSSMNFMEYQVLGYESPLFGRRTAQLKITALTYRDLREFYPNLPCEQLALLYGVADGIPHYINKLDVRKDVPTALIDNFFDPSGYLFEEPENLLKQELREPAMYNSVITAIARGASRSNEIATKTGLSTGVCAKYLNVLISLGILKKENAVLETGNKKTLYQLEDNFFRFWYRFVPQNTSVINSGLFPSLYDRAVGQYLSDYMGLVFEKMCRDFVLRYAKNLPLICREVGQWWGTDPKTKKQVQIDIVGLPLDGDTYLIGSCKYKNTPVGTEELALLRSYASVFGHGTSYCYAIFSKGGFTKNLTELAGKGKVLLYTLEDLYQ